MPFFREAGQGSGPGVVCLHANSSSSVQWRALMEVLAPTCHVLAPDLCGAGKSPAWTSDRPIGLSDEAALLEPVYALAGDPFAIVGHSYGAAVALVTAVAQPSRVRALALYEPTLFAVVDAESPPPNEADDVRSTVAAAKIRIDAGDLNGAAELFIDLWMGAGAWASMPESRRSPIAAGIVSLPAWGRALSEEPTPLSAFAALDVPVLYMMGRDSRPSSRAVGRILTATLPRVEVVEFEGIGHMGPVTHPERVNEAIARFLA